MIVSEGCWKQEKLLASLARSKMLSLVTITPDTRALSHCLRNFSIRYLTIHSDKLVTSAGILHISQLEELKDGEDSVNIIKVVVLEDRDAVLRKVNVLKKSFESCWCGVLNLDRVLSGTCHVI